MNSPASVRERAHELLKDGPVITEAFIDGAIPKTDEFLPRYSPIDGQEVSRFACCGPVEVDLAVKAAKRTFDQGVWRLQSAEQRQAVLTRFCELILQKADELALIESLENGMPYGMCRNRNVVECGQCMQWFGEAASKLTDESVWLDRKTYATVSREPVGVVATIIPWNFPLMIASWKLAPALAAGCSVVIKPAEQAGSAVAMLGQLAVDAGIPAGVLNIVTGTGENAGAALAAHPDVDCIAFTGSGAVGKQIMQTAAETMKRVWLECGGKTAIVVLEDCKDFDQAITESAQAFFRHQGQICNAGSRLLVPEAKAQQAAGIAVKTAQSLIVGNPLDPNVNFGPVIQPEAAQEILSKVKLAVDQGAKLLCGGGMHDEFEGGCFVEPTVLGDVKADMDAAKYEIFGPVLSIMPYANEDEAVAIANGTDYGLGASVYTRDLGRGHLFARRLQAGSVQVNRPAGASLRLPFGGYKQSGFGRDKSVHAFDKYTELKSTIFALDK